MKASGRSTPLDCAVQMRVSRRCIASGLAIALAFFAFPWGRTIAAERNAVLEPSPLCPWREAQRDLPLFFPGATNYMFETLILTPMMASAQKRLGRPLNPSENPLRIYHPLGPAGVSGSILVTRVKGEHGGIELVIGVDTNQQVIRLIVQSQREPPAIASAITDLPWLSGFRGKTSESSLRLGVDLPDTAPEARGSAQAVAEGVRSQLILLGYAELLRATSGSAKDNHVHAHP